MNRRKFIKGSLTLGVLAAMTRGATAVDAIADQSRGRKGVRVGAKEDRFRDELLIMGGRFDLKVSGRDTGGQLCIYDTERSTKGGPAMHFHHAQDEWFYVIRGEFIVQVGDEVMKIGPGDSAFAPRKVPHAFAMVSEGTGQMLVLFQPAGTMENFFMQMRRLGREIPKDMESRLKALFEEHGMQVVGPPLKI